MSKFSCKEYCKKTRQIKESQFCTGQCENINGRLVFDCELLTNDLNSDQKSFLTCHFWDMGIKDNCSVCPLGCPENKNPIVLRTKSAIKNVSNIMESLGPMMQMSGVDPLIVKKAYDAMGSAEINTNTSAEIEDTIKITNYARDILNTVMSGGAINIVEFKKIKEEIEKKYKK